MDITQIVRVGYGYYPNPTRIKNKKIKNKTINLSHRHSHSLCLSSVLTDSWSLSLSPVSANPHHHSLSLSPLIASCCGKVLSLTYTCIYWFWHRFGTWFSFLVLCESTWPFYHSLSLSKWLILFPSFASLVSKEKSFLWVSGFTCSLLVVYLCCLIEFIVWVCVRFWF